jgi:hypothetical protein
VIYFAQTPTGSIKIGKAVDIDRRIGQLEDMFRGPVALLGTMSGGVKEEKQLHRRFAHLRFVGTEQFRPGPDLMELIGRPLLIGANPDAVEATPKPCSIRLELDPATHRDFRIEAAKEGQSMAALAKRLAEEWVARRKVASK